MKIILIVAYGKNFVIGHRGTLPWYLPNDLIYFKKNTLGYPVIMGRRTWESLHYPLPERINIVVSRNTNNNNNGNIHDVIFVKSLDHAIINCHAFEKIFIIGGATLYRYSLPLAQTIMATEIHSSFKGDVFFPKISKNDWIEVDRKIQEPENGYKYDFVIYTRIN